jgi:hypothetical protein
MRDTAIHRLRRIRTGASRQLHAERERRMPDFARITRLKKLKLLIKDRIAAITSCAQGPLSA